MFTPKHQIPFTVCVCSACFSASGFKPLGRFVIGSTVIVLCHTCADDVLTAIKQRIEQCPVPVSNKLEPKTYRKP